MKVIEGAVPAPHYGSCFYHCGRRVSPGTQIVRLKMRNGRIKWAHAHCHDSV